MMAVVFFMQPIGQVLATLITLAFMSCYRRYIPDEPVEKCVGKCIGSLDAVWRIIIGFGALPAAVALVFRLTIPESIRYTLHVMNNNDHADVDLLFFPQDQNANGDESGSHDVDSNGAPSGVQSNPGEHSFADFKRHFIRDGHWTTLAGTSFAWLLLDLPFYGLNANSPLTIAKIWDARRPPSNLVYSHIVDSAVRSLVIVSIGAIGGGFIMIAAANRVRRQSLQKWGFLALAALFIVIGATMKPVMSNTSFGGTLIPLYILCQGAFNFGTYLASFPTLLCLSFHLLTALLIFSIIRT
jgi:MFS transporter, PHS family, inorganic phosphate transporter